MTLCLGKRSTVTMWAKHIYLAHFSPFLFYFLRKSLFCGKCLCPTIFQYSHQKLWQKYVSRFGLACKQPGYVTLNPLNWIYVHVWVIIGKHVCVLWITLILRFFFFILHFSGLAFPLGSIRNYISCYNAHIHVQQLTSICLSTIRHVFIFFMFKKLLKLLYFSLQSLYLCFATQNVGPISMLFYFYGLSTVCGYHISCCIAIHKCTSRNAAAIFKHCKHTTNLISMQTWNEKRLL